MRDSMGEWPSTRASRVLAALLRIGWRVMRRSGSHAATEPEGPIPQSGIVGVERADAGGSLYLFRVPKEIRIPCHYHAASIRGCLVQMQIVAYAPISEGM
jgi:hypothetical protein